MYWVIGEQSALRDSHPYEDRKIFRPRYQLLDSNRDDVEVRDIGQRSALPSFVQTTTAPVSATRKLEAEGGIACMRHGIKLSPRDRRLAFWGWALGGFLLRAKRPAEALEEARLAARRDPRLFLPPLLETLAHAALGQTDAAKISLISARRLRPELTLREVEISHGRQAVRTLADLWAEARP